MMSDRKLSNELIDLAIEQGANPRDIYDERMEQFVKKYINL